MGIKTIFLKLALLGTGEQRDTWGEVLNDNFERIDDKTLALNDEITAARFNALSLPAFLSVGHESNGSIKPIAEVTNARNSVLHGSKDSLVKRLDAGDIAFFRAMEGHASLRSSIARSSYMQGSILDGARDANGYPTWLGFTGANVQVDGGVTNILMLINGQKARIRTLKQITLSGTAGLKHLYAQFNNEGLDVVTSVNGTTGTNTFVDTSVNFVTQNVKQYDVLTILSGINAGSYLISTVVNPTQVQIFGVFPSPLSGMNYTIKDPLEVTLGYDNNTQSPAVGKLYIGEADFDSSAVTAVRALHFEDVFVGAWQAVNVVITPQFNLTWNHNLLSNNLEVIVQAAAGTGVNDPVTPMDIGSLTNTTVLNFSDTTSFQPGTFNPGTSNATYFPVPSFTGLITSSLSGSVILDNAVRVQFTRTQVQVKNPLAGTFFKDFSGAALTSGFVRVIVRRKA